MKSFSSLKSLALISAVVFFLASCSNERYGSIQRGTVKAKETAKVEKSTKTTVQTAEKVVVVKPILTETTSSSEVLSSFNALKNVKMVEPTTVKGRISKKIISKMFSPIVTATIKTKVELKSLEIESALGGDSGMPYWLALILCIIPLGGVISVGLATDWNVTKMIISFLLYCCLYIPGLIYSLVTVVNNQSSFE